LKLLPKDIAERYMAVPLGEMQHRLVIAMLDADNIQAVDFLSNRIGRPLKVYVASESGILQVLKQYGSRHDTAGVSKVLADDKNKPVEKTEKDEDTTKKTDKKNIADLVEDSPISKVLTEVLEFA